MQGLFIVALSIVLKAISSSAAGGTETLVGIVGKDFVMLGADSSMSQQSIVLTSSNVDKIAIIVDPQLYNDNDVFERKIPLAEAHQRQYAIVAAAAGNAADTDRLIGILRAHGAIREYEAGVGCDVNYIDLDANNNLGVSAGQTLVASEPGLDVEAIAHLARGQVAAALRSRNPLEVSLLIAGMTFNDENPSNIHDFASQQLRWQVEQTTTSHNPSLLSSMSNDGIDPVKATRLQPRLFWLDMYGALQELKYGAHGNGSNFLLSILDNGYQPNMNREQAANLLRDCFSQLRQRYVINSPQPPCIKCVDAFGCHMIVEPLSSS